ncbi:hypothetical protein COLO4_20265 [Corchorus olitorius]|uniref:Uncharacterized protein n=1 Tax=Corchorus olitorius TaxID=93759 RepID=A0A1R3J0R9_9ROSI|nr:hypothetical protein COLO4_20265 [Corchorus olitorius]
MSPSVFENLCPPVSENLCPSEGRMTFADFFMKEVMALESLKLSPMRNFLLPKVESKCNRQHALIMPVFQLLGIFDRVGDSIHTYLKDEQQNVSDQNVAIEVASIFLEAGFPLKEHDYNLSMFNWTFPIFASEGRVEAILRGKYRPKPKYASSARSFHTCRFPDNSFGSMTSKPAVMPQPEAEEQAKQLEEEQAEQLEEDAAFPTIKQGMKIISAEREKSSELDDIFDLKALVAASTEESAMEDIAMVENGEQIELLDNTHQEFPQMGETGNNYRASSYRFHRVLNAMNEQLRAAWSVLISACVHHSSYGKAFHMFKKKNSLGIQSNELRCVGVTCDGALFTCWFSRLVQFNFIHWDFIVCFTQPRQTKQGWTVKGSYCDSYKSEALCDINYSKILAAEEDVVPSLPASNSERP